MSRTRRFTLLLAPLGAALVLAGCAVQWQNRQASEALARAAAPAGSAYVGWRLYQDRCARCHGPAGNGTANAPDLTQTLRQMGPRAFVASVLKRYDWNLPAADDAQVDRVLGRSEPALQMPAWGEEPQVSAHVMDLHAYLAARAEGTLGPGRPPVR